MKPCKTCHRVAPDFGAECVTCWCERRDREEGYTKRYFLSVAGHEHEVTEAEFVDAERAAGFHNTLGRPDKPGTAGFSNGSLSGRVEHVKGRPVTTDPDIECLLAWTRGEVQP